MLKLSHSEAKLLLKAAKGKSSMTAKEYREALASPKSKPIKRNKRVFAFTFKTRRLSSDTYLFTLHGRHLSTNGMNSLGRGDAIRYKSALKKAFSDNLLVDRSSRPTMAFSRVVLTPTYYNPRSRDDDSDGTSKIIRDCIINAGYVIDDDRKHLEQRKYAEVISKEWKIEMLLENIPVADTKN